MSDVMDPLQFQEETQDILSGVSRQSSLQLTPAPPPPTTNEGTRLILREPSVGSTALDRRHIRDLISRSPDPDTETDKIMSSLYMAQITPHSPSYIYRNFDEVNEQFWGQVYKRNTRDIFRVAYNNASVDIEIGKVMAQAITRPDDEIDEYLQEAARLEQFKSEEFAQDYSFAQKIVEATGQFLPYYVNPVVELAPIVGSAALIGGLAATGAGVGAGAVLASAGSAGRTVMTVGSTPSIGRVMAGLSFYHMAMTEDEDGNGIPLNIARGHAMWSGILQGALGAMQFRTITKGATMANLWRQSVLTTAKKGLITGRPAAIGIGFLKNYGATLAEGVVEEVLQESVGYWMHQSAIEFANKTTEANIERGNWGEFLEMVGETAVRTTMGLSVLSGLGAARGTWRSVRSQASIDARAFTSIQDVEQAVGKENVTAEIINAIAEGDRESALNQISNVIRDNPMPKDIGVTKTDTGSYVASAGEQNIMTMDVSVEDGAATLSTSEVAPEITNRYGQTQIDRMMLNSIDAMVTRFAQDNPGMTLEFDRNDANQSLIKEAIENQDPNMRIVNQVVRSENVIIQVLETEIQNVQRQIESVQEAVVTEQMTEEEITAQQEEVAQMSLEQQQRIADLEAGILDHQAILQRVIDYKSAYETKYFDRQDVTNKPSEQVVVAELQALEATVTVDTEFVVNEYLHKQFPNASDGEVNMMQLLLELEAERKGVTLPQLMETDYEASLSIMAGEAVDAEFAARGLANPASTVFSDSQRLMKFSTEATFSDFFHEWVHISVSNLNQQQLQVLADFTGEQTTQWETWSSDSHEQVVAAAFQVVKGTQEFTGRLAQVLEYIKTTFKRAAELLIKTKEINPEVENVLRAIIAEPATEATQAVVSDVTIGDRLSTDMMLDRVRQSQEAFKSNMEQRSQQMAQEQQQVLQAIENDILQVVEPDGFIGYSNLDAFARQNQMSITDAASILENIINRQSERGDADSRDAQQKSLESLEKIRRESTFELFAPPSIEDQRQRISESIDRFEAVSDKQLRKYANDPEIGNKVRQEIQRREADNVLINESVEANRESIQGMSQSEAIDFMTTFSDATPELARRVWNEINVVDINQGNTLWFNSLANMDIQRIVDNAKDVLLAIGPLAQTWTPNGGQHDKSVRTWIRNNATKMRRALAYDIPVYEAGGDVSRADIDIQALTQLNRELVRSDVRDLSSLQNPYAIDVDALRTVLRQEGRALLAENITDGYFADVLKATSQRLSQLDADLTVEINRVQGFVNNIRTMIPSRISVRDPAANFNSLLIKLQRNLQDGGNLDGSFRIASQQISNQIREATGQVIDLTKLNRLLTQRIENQKRREVVRKERQKMKKMVKSMQRAANFNSIHINQRSQIEALVSGIDPEFRTRKTEARLREITESMGDDPMAFTQLDSRTKNMLGKSNLNEFSFQQIQELYERVKALTEEGREAMRVQREAMESARKRVLQGLVDDMRTDIQPPDVAPPEPGTRPRGTFLQQLRDVSLSTLDIARLADMLDGRQGFRGKNHNFFVTQVLNAEANMYQAMDARDTWMVDRLKELGYDVNEKNYRRTIVDLLSQDTDSQGNTFTIDGVNYSLDAVLEMYAGFKNAKKHAAIVLGNGRDRILSLIEQGVNDRQAMEIVNAEFQGLVDRLTPEQRRLGDLIIDEYAQHYDRIAETYGRYHNAILGSEEFYTPIVVRGFTSLKHEAQMAKEILISHNYRRAGLDRKFTIDRLENIPLNSRRPIELGLFRNWEQSSLAQENFIAYSEWNYLANGIFSTAQVGEAFRDKVTRQRADGEAMMNQLKDYHKRVLTRQELLENTPINKMISGLRRRTSQAYLAFNAITVMKQAPSIAFYMVEANPTDIFQSIGKYIQNPSQFIAETEGRNPIPRQAIREFAMIEQYMANPDINIGMRRLTEYGMAMIKIVDNAVTRIGEDAVYTKALRDGLSPQEAIQRAREVTMRTQPAGRPKDMSKIFNIESMYLLTQFSQQLNKVWQMMTYDIPQAYAPQQYRSQQLNTVVAMMISSYFIWALNNRQVMPDVEEPSDFVDLMLTQTLASVPVVGSAITQARQGFTSEPAIITPFTRSVDLVNQIQRAMDPERELTDAQRDRLVRTILEAFALGAGLPAVAPSRIIKASQYFRDSEDFTDTLSTALTGGVWTMRGEE